MWNHQEFCSPIRWPLAMHGSLIKMKQSEKFNSSVTCHTAGAQEPHMASGSWLDDVDTELPSSWKILLDRTVNQFTCRGVKKGKCPSSTLRDVG